jgi:hypothetical protein
MKKKKQILTTIPATLITTGMPGAKITSTKKLYKVLKKKES